MNNFLSVFSTQHLESAGVIKSLIYTNRASTEILSLTFSDDYSGSIVRRGEDFVSVLNAPDGTAIPQKNALEAKLVQLKDMGNDLIAEIFNAPLESKGQKFIHEYAAKYKFDITDSSMRI